MPLARPLRRGLQLNLRPKLVAEKAFGGLPARNRTAMVGDLKSEIHSKTALHCWFSIPPNTWQGDAWTPTKAFEKPTWGSWKSTEENIVGKNMLELPLWELLIVDSTVRWFAKVLSDDVFYGRAIMKIPRQVRTLHRVFVTSNGWISTGIIVFCKVFLLSWC